jgi:hypothetical protein
MTTKVEIATLLATCVLAAFAAAGFGYYLGRDTASSQVDQLKREIDTFKSANNIKNAFDYLSDLRGYNDNLFEFSKYEKQIADKQSELDKLLDNTATLRRKAESLQNQLNLASKAQQNSQAQIRDLTRRLKLKYSVNESVSLEKGQSHSFLNGAAIIGVQSVYDSRAVITLQNQTHFIDVGGTIEIQVEDARCMVALRNTSYDGNSVFDLICRTQLK